MTELFSNTLEKHVYVYLNVVVFYIFYEIVKDLLHNFLTVNNFVQLEKKTDEIEHLSG